MIRFLLANKTALLVLAGVLLRDLWCWTWAKVWYWHRRRLSLRQAEEALQQQRERETQNAARMKSSQREQTVYIFITPSRDLETLILPMDRKRFPVLNDDELSEKGRALPN